MGKREGSTPASSLADFRSGQVRKPTLVPGLMTVSLYHDHESVIAGVFVSISRAQISLSIPGNVAQSSEEELDSFNYEMVHKTRHASFARGFREGSENNRDRRLVVKALIAARLSRISEIRQAQLMSSNLVQPRYLL